MKRILFFCGLLTATSTHTFAEDICFIATQEGKLGTNVGERISTSSGPLGLQVEFPTWMLNNKTVCEWCGYIERYQFTFDDDRTDIRISGGTMFFEGDGEWKGQKISVEGSMPRSLDPVRTTVKLCDNIDSLIRRDAFNQGLFNEVRVYPNYVERANTAFFWPDAVADGNWNPFVTLTASIEYGRGRKITVCERQNLNEAINPGQYCSATFKDEELDQAAAGEALRNAQDWWGELNNIINGEGDWPGLKKIETHLEQNIKDMYDAIRRISDKSIEEITYDDLDGLEEAKIMLQNYKEVIARSEAEVKLIETQLVDAWNGLSGKIDNELEAQGVDINEWSVEPTIDISSMLPVSGYSAIASENIQFYNSYASSVIATLNELYNAGDNKRFLIQVRYWLNNLEKLKKSLESKKISSPDEWNALAESTERVEAYVYTILDRDLWFKDSPVPVDTRDAIRSINEYSSVYGEVIESEVRTWREQDMTTEKNEFLIMLNALGAGIKAAMQANENTNFDNLLAGAAKAVKEATICATKVMLASDFGDFYEIIIGKDLCSGEPLSVSQRLWSTVGLGFGSARFWRGVGKATGLTSAARKISNNAAAALEKAKEIGMSRNELDSFTRKLNKRRNAVASCQF